MKRGHLVVGLLICFLTAIVILVSASRPSKPVAVSTAPIRVVASFYPLAEFSKRVGGDRVSVVNITPAGVEPHDFEPTPRDVIAAHEAELFVYNGGGIDTWADALARDLPVRSIEMTTLIRTTRSEDAIAGDPHAWLDPILAASEVSAIRDALLSIDPENADAYRANADVYLAKLADLDASFTAGLGACKIKTVIASHDALAYLAKRYGFTSLAVAGLSPDEEPSPRTLADLAGTAKKHGVKYIFFESLVSPALAETLASEIGASTLEFNPLEGLTEDEILAGHDYISVMQSNLEALKIAMVCTQHP